MDFTPQIAASLKISEKPELVAERIRIEMRLGGLFQPKDEMQLRSDPRRNLINLSCYASGGRSD
jgi:hypothetical protein